jgi:hypothetical protein
MSDGGKGSTPRPLSVSNEEYATRWDAIFGRDLKENQKVLNEVPEYNQDEEGSNDTQMLIERA